MAEAAEIVARSESEMRIEARSAIVVCAATAVALALFFEFTDAPLASSAFALIILTVCALAWTASNLNGRAGTWFFIVGLTALAYSGLAWLQIDLAAALLPIPAGLAVALTEGMDIIEQSLREEFGTFPYPTKISGEANRKAATG